MIDAESKLLPKRPVRELEFSHCKWPSVAQLYWAINKSFLLCYNILTPIDIISNFGHVIAIDVLSESMGYKPQVVYMSKNAFISKDICIFCNEGSSMVDRYRQNCFSVTFFSFINLAISQLRKTAATFLHQ